MKGISKKFFIGLLCTIFIAVGVNSTDALAKAKHNVTYIYGLKSVTVQVPHGGNAAVPTDTYVPGYQFVSWVGNAANVTEDRIILGAYNKIATAQPVATPQTWLKKVSNAKSAPWPDWWATLNIPKGVPGKTCAVHWYNAWNGELWKTDMVPYGASLPTPPDPCLSGYEFAGWEGDWTNVTEDRAISAHYYINHKLRFIDSVDGDTIDVVYVRDGDGAWVDPPHHDGKKFVHYEYSDGGEYSGQGVHSDHDIYAIYKNKE